MEVRKRNVLTELEEPVEPRKLESFDVFTKLPVEYQERSLWGATISIITFAIMILLIVLELWSFFHSPIVFSYNIDDDHDSKLRINIDMTVAMKCALIGADIIDQGGNTVSSESSIAEEDVDFELTQKGNFIFKTMRKLNEMRRRNVASLQHVLWSRDGGDMHLWASDPAFLHRPDSPAAQPGCRIHGSVFVRKMPGNFHVTAGKHVELGFIGGHAHLSGFLSPTDYNFSHRIHHLSFGNPESNTLSPLDAEESIVTSNYHLFQYFVEVVPTKIRTLVTNIDTYQFAVRQQNRSIDHSRGSHGMPGIFVRYDISPLRVTVGQDRPGVVTLLVRLSAVVGGVFATAGLLLQLFLAGPVAWWARWLCGADPGLLPTTVTS